jgi:hypothetical protein
MNVHRRAIFAIVVVAVIPLVAGLLHVVKMPLPNPPASSVSQRPLQATGKQSQPAPAGAATTTAAGNLEQQTTPTADEQAAIEEANQLLIDRVGTTTFQSGFQYSHVEVAGPAEYFVWYQFSPPTDPGDSFSEGVSIQEMKTTDIHQINGNNVDEEYPDCATYPKNCDIRISTARALQIAQTALPGNWSGGFRIDDFGDTNYSTKYAWFMTTDAKVFGCHHYMEIDAVSGNILNTNSGCDIPPP